MPAPYLGRCACGAVRYRVNAEPVTLYACHCTDCQRRTGSAFGLSMIVPRESVVLESGTLVDLKATMPDGRVSHNKACSACSIRLWGEPAKLPQFIIIRPGTLEDTSWIRPVAHIWTRSAQPGTVFEPGAVKFEQNAPPGELARLWKERTA